jgi:CO/xanthine dehydrogenase Mo-binding subunit
MKKTGKGMAAAFYPIGLSGGGDPSQAMIKMNADGTADLFMGSVEIGQGSKTVMAQIAAEELGIDYEQVNVLSSDTSSGPFCMGSFASRVTFIAGNAVMKAAREARELLFDTVSEDLKAPAGDLEVFEGMIRVKADHERCISLADAVGKATFANGVLVVGRGAHMKPPSGSDEETGACEPCYTMSYAAVHAEVEVDTNTGVVEVTKLVAVNDIGKAINPALAEGQAEGGIGMGLGAALMENRIPDYPGMEQMPTTLSEYIIPTFMDMPELEIGFIEVPSDGGPYGARAIGEMAANAQAPAIINAIYDAVGVRITALPATPEKILRALADKEAA